MARVSCHPTNSRPDPIKRGGRVPRRTAVATGTYSSSAPSRTARSSTPPRLMSPRPTNVDGNSRRVPRCSSSGLVYFGEATLPSSTTSRVGSAHTRRRSRTNGSTKRGSSASMGTALNSRSASSVTGVSGGNRPLLAVMTKASVGGKGARVRQLAPEVERADEREDLADRHRLARLQPPRQVDVRRAQQQLAPPAAHAGWRQQEDARRQACTRFYHR